MTFRIAAAAVCLLLSAFFSASEMALSSANRLRLSSQAEDGSRPAARALRLTERFDDALSAILIGNNFVNIALSSLSSVIALTALGEEYAWAATAAVTVLVIIFGETVPKIVAKKNANRFLMTFAPLLRGLSVVLTPLVRLVVAAVHGIAGLFRGEEADADETEAVEELQSIIETAEDEEVIDEGQGELLRAALDFDEISASEVMTARVDMTAIDIEDSWDEIHDALCAANHSRIPVYEGSIDNIIGVLLVNRFFKAMISRRRPNIRNLLMKPCFIYRSTKLPAVLEQLRASRQHLAIVTDEYGGVLGIVSMEDVLEEIVGDIWDETDEIKSASVPLSGGGMMLDGDMSIGDFAETLGIDEEELKAESSTVGGWVMERFGGFPETGDVIRWKDVAVTVMKVDGRRVEKLLVERA